MHVGLAKNNRPCGTECFDCRSITLGLHICQGSTTSSGLHVVGIEVVFQQYRYAIQCSRHSTTSDRRLATATRRDQGSSGFVAGEGAVIASL